MSSWTSEDAREFLGIIRNEASKVFRDLTAQTSSICACLAVITDISESGDVSVRLLSSPDDGSQDFVARNRSSSTLEVGDSVWLHYWGDYTNAYIAVRNMGDVLDAITADNVGAVSYIGDQGLDVDERAQARENIGITDIIVDSLDSESVTGILAPNQGRVLNERITTEKADLEGDKMGALELLWTNASPSSDFSAQTISLGLSGYDAVEIDYYSTKGQTSGLQRKVVPIGETSYISFGQALFTLRQVTVSSTGVTFGAGGRQTTYGSSTITANAGDVIPYKIYGMMRRYAA